jgi:hypothetical protein
VLLLNISTDVNDIKMSASARENNNKVSLYNLKVKWKHRSSDFEFSANASRNVFETPPIRIYWNIQTLFIFVIYLVSYARPVANFGYP